MKDTLREIRELDRSIIALLMLGLFTSIGNGLINVLIQPYLKHLGLSPQDVGFLQFVSSIATTLSLVPAAYLADMYGRKKIALISLASSLPGFLLVVFTDSLSYMSIGFALLGIGNALTAVTLNPLLADVAPREKLDVVASASQVLGLAGSSLGMGLSWLPQVVTGLSENLLQGYRLLMFVGGVVSTASFVFLMFVRDPNGTPRGFRLSFSRENFLLAGLSGLTAFGAGASVWLINYYFMSKFSVEAGELGTRMLAETLLMIPATSLAPLVSEKLGTLKAVVVLQLLSIPFLLSTALPSSFPIAASLYTLRSLLMNAANPLMWALSMKIIGEEERSRYMMLNTLAWQFMGGLGSAIGGWLMGVNYDYPLYFTATIYLLQAFLLYAFFKDKS